MNTFRYLLKSLFNNSVILEGRKRKFIESFFVFVIAMIIALVPSIVSIASIKGSAIIESGSNAVDEGLRDFSKTMNEKEIKFTIKDDGEEKIITINDLDKWNFGDYYSYKRFDGDKYIERFRVYLEINSDNSIISEKVKAIQSQDDKDPVPSLTSYLIIGKTCSYLCLYAKNAEGWKTPSASRFLQYDRFEDGQEVMSSYIGEHSLNNWKAFIDTGYASTKVVTLFTQIGIYAAINAGSTLLMGLMIFFVTRGKKNPYRDYKFIEAFKIVGIASLSPSIISAIIGFIAPSLSPLLYMFTIGLRSMWMTSKNLSFMSTGK